MKKTIIALITLLTISSHLIMAQKSFIFSAGVTTTKLGQSATKNIIDRYNETRPWLDKKMGTTNPFAGYVFHAGVDKGSYTFLLGYNTQRSTVKASGTTPSGVFAERELRVKSAFWSINGLWDFGSMWDLDFGLGIHLGGAFGGGDYSTRVTGESEFKKINKTGYDGSGIFLGVFYERYLLGDEDQGIGVKVTPYFRGFPRLNSTDMTPLLQELDAANASVPLDNKINGHMAFGIMLEATFRLER